MGLLGTAVLYVRKRKELADAACFSFLAVYYEENMKANVTFGEPKVVHWAQSIGFRGRWGRKQARKARPELTQGRRY